MGNGDFNCDCDFIAMEYRLSKFLEIFLTLFMFYFRNICCEHFGTCKPFSLKHEHLDKQLVGHGFFEAETGYHVCVRYCWYFAACKSIDYYRPNRTCRLNDADGPSTQETELEVRAHSVFSDITEWPIEMAGSCGSRPCSSKQLCAPTNPPLCIDIICGDLPSISNGNIELLEPEANKLLDIAFVTCNEGFFTNLANVTCQISEISGNATCVFEDPVTLKCHISGKWETASCDLADCGEPTTENGVATLTNPANMTFMATASVTCNEGYETVKSFISCQTTATWEPGDCTKISCGDVPYIANGETNLAFEEHNLYLDTATVTCDYGFTATASSIKCQSSKLWETAACVCMQPGDYMGTLSTTTLEYSCQRWDSQIPHVHAITDVNFLEATAFDAANYCRAAGETYLWCYTTDPGKRWDFCTKPAYVC